MENNEIEKMFSEIIERITEIENDAVVTEYEEWCLKNYDIMCIADLINNLEAENQVLKKDILVLKRSLQSTAENIIKAFCDPANNRKDTKGKKVITPNCVMPKRGRSRSVGSGFVEKPPELNMPPVSGKNDYGYIPPEPKGNDIGYPKPGKSVNHGKLTLSNPNIPLEDLLNGKKK